MNRDYQFGLSQLAFIPNSPGRAATLPETFNAALQQFNLAESGDAERNALSQARDEQRAIYEEITGEPMPDPHPVLVSREGFGTNKEALVIGRFLEENPEYADRFNLDFEGRAAEISREAEANYNQVMQRAGGVTAFLGAAGGAMVGSVTNPITLGVTVATLPLSWSYTGGRILITALLEAGIAGATEIPLQAVAQEYRGRIGLEAGWARGAENVLMTAAGAGALTSLLMGLGKGGKAVLERFVRREDISAADRSAAEQIIRQIDEEESIPVAQPDAPDMAMFRAQLDAAYLSALRGEPIRADADPVLARTELMNSTILTQRKAWARETSREIGDLLPAEIDSVFSRILEAQGSLKTARDEALEARIADADANSRMALEALRGTEDAQRSLAQRADALDQAVEALERGRVPDDPQLLSDVLDADTVARMQAVRQDLAAPGLPKARRQALEREAQLLIEALPETTAQNLARKQAHLRGLIDEAGTQRQAAVAAYKSLEQVARAHKQARQKAQAASIARLQAAIKGEYDKGTRPSPVVSEHQSARVAAARGEASQVEARAAVAPQVAEAMAATLGRIAEADPGFRVMVEDVAPDGSVTVRELTPQQVQKELADEDEFLRAFEECRRG